VLPPGLTLRPARASDPVADHIRVIYEEHGLEFDLAFEDDLEDVIASYAAGRFLVIEDAEGLVATGAVLPNGAARVVKRMYVAPRGRRLGLARHLLRELCTFGDAAWTELWSDVRFRNAHRLYRSEGFVSGSVRVLTDPDGSVERYFRKD